MCSARAGTTGAMLGQCKSDGVFETALFEELGSAACAAVWEVKGRHPEQGPRPLRVGGSDDRVLAQKNPCLSKNRWIACARRCLARPE